jgi:hypothetical protein
MVKEWRRSRENISNALGEPVPPPLASYSRLDALLNNRPLTKTPLHGRNAASAQIRGHRGKNEWRDPDQPPLDGRARCAHQDVLASAIVRSCHVGDTLVLSTTTIISIPDREKCDAGRREHESSGVFPCL